MPFTVEVRKDYRVEVEQGLNDSQIVRKASEVLKELQEASTILAVRSDERADSARIDGEFG